MAFDARWLRHLGVRPQRVSIIRVDGESMAPTLSDGAISLKWSGSKALL